MSGYELELSRVIATKHETTTPSSLVSILLDTKYISLA